MITYKGTDKNLQCRGFRYEIGKEYEADGAIRCGNKGFHSCKAPLDVFLYYAPGDGSKYFVCDADGDIDEGIDDTKIASSKLTLKASLSIPALVKAQIEYVKSKTATEHTDKRAATAGERGAATAGERGAATAGYRGAATAGDSGAATAGHSGAATAGHSGAATAGERGAATAGHGGAATAGDRGAATAGNRGAATAGERGAATAGNRGAATAGERGAATAGERGAATSRGKVSVGENGVGTVRGNGVMIRGGLGALLVIAEENDDDYNIKDWKAVVVDDEIIKADTWYKLDHGELVIAEEEGAE